MRFVHVHLRCREFSQWRCVNCTESFSIVCCFSFIICFFSHSLPPESSVDINLYLIVIVQNLQLLRNTVRKHTHTHTTHIQRNNKLNSSLSYSYKNYALCCAYESQWFFSLYREEQTPHNMMCCDVRRSRAHGKMSFTWREISVYLKDRCSDLISR